MGNCASDPDATLIELLRRPAIEQPDRLAFTFLPDGETEKNAFTFAEIDLHARAVAAWLGSTSTRGDRVLLLNPSGPDFVCSLFGCFYAGAVAVPAYPLDSTRLQRTASRLRGIVNDAQPVVGLTTASSLGLLDKVVGIYPELKRVRWIATESISLNCAANWMRPATEADTLAILQYTSGSTATPKGVMISHRNVLENARMIQEAHQYSDNCTFVGWIPLAHDWGLINNVLQPVYLRASSILMPPEAFLQKPIRWLRAISRFENVTSGGPSFAYDLCVARITNEERDGLNLESWICAGIGANPVRPATLDRFVTKFGGCGFRRKAFYCGYGLAEATLLVCDSDRSEEPRILRVQKAALEQNNVLINPPEDVPASNIVSCGKPPSAERVVIADPRTNEVCPSGRVGEIWVSGGNVAQGYWNNPAETNAAFLAFLKDSGEGPFLRTGDLGFIDQDELFVTGRLKDLIIIRGRNIYPEDIELIVEQCHPALRPGCTAVFSIQSDFDERLVIVQEVRSVQPSRLAGIIDAIREAVFREYELVAHAIVLVRERSILKTSSGKLQRQACRSAYLSGELDILEKNVLSSDRPEHRRQAKFIAPRTTVEKKLARIWMDVLNVEHVGIDDRFFDLGGDSLASVQCMARIRDEFAFEQFSPEIFLYAPTLAEMAQFISDSRWSTDRVNEVLPIQSNGSGIPLVLVFPGMECQSLVRRMGPDRRILGIRSTCIDSLPAPHTIEQIASECIVRLRRHLPQGPYALAGWCAAGVVAMEMARRLQEGGEQVAFVALFDARDVFLPPMNPARRVLVRICRFTQRITFFASRVRRGGIHLLWQRAAIWTVQVREAARKLQGLPAGQSDVLIQALRRYQPKPWPGRMLHLWATDRPKGAFRSPEFLWRPVSPNEFVFYEVPGDHISMLREPNVDTVAKILAIELDLADVSAKKHHVASVTQEIRTTRKRKLRN